MPIFFVQTPNVFYNFYKISLKASKLLMNTSLNTEQKLFLKEFQSNLNRHIRQNINDLNLFPSRIGPHFAYTLDDPEQQPIIHSLQQYLEGILSEKIQQYFIKQQNTTQQTQLVNNQLNARQQYNASLGILKNSKYNKYTTNFKKRVIGQIEQLLKQEELYFPKSKRSSEHKRLRYIIRKKSKQYQIHPKNIIRWMDTKQLIEQDTGRKPKYPQLQQKLFKYVCENPGVRRQRIISEAKSIMKDLGQGQQFMFSKGWYQRFKIRCQKRKSKKKTVKQYEQLSYNSQYKQDNSLKMQEQNIQLYNDSYLSLGFDSDELRFDFL